MKHLRTSCNHHLFSLFGCPIGMLGGPVFVGSSELIHLRRGLSFGSDRAAALFF